LSLFFRTLPVPRNAVVLDLGCGDKPHPRANVLCDRFASGSAERGGALAKIRPTVIADAEELPFRNKAFDYVVCSHVLEHARDPRRFLGEMMRVAGGGYVECPTPLAEALFGWGFHRWLVERGERGILVLRPKDTSGVFGDVFHKLAQTSLPFRLFLWLNRDLFYVRFDWRKRIRFRIAAGDRNATRAPGALSRCGPATRMRQERRPDSKMLKLLDGVKAIVRNSIYRVTTESVMSVLDDRLQCHKCKMVLRLVSGCYVCSRCGRSYPVRGHAVSFL